MMKARSFILFVLLVLIAGCGKNILKTKNDNPDYKTGQFCFSFNITNMPSEVTALNGYLSKAGEDTISFTFDIYTDSATALVEDIPVGTWSLNVRAFDSNSNLIYFGSANVTVVPGVTTPVSLHMNPSTGGLSITVTWGDFGEILENSVLYYDLNSNFHMSNEAFTLTYTFQNGCYPIWLDSKTKIGYHSPSNFMYYVIDATTKDTLNSYNITGYGTFISGRYSEHLEVFLFDVNVDGLRSIGIMDWNGNITIISREYSVTNPVCSGVDDWIYYRKNVDGIYNIFRMKPDGSSEEQITNNLEYTYGNFSISYDGNTIVAPKFNDDSHYIAKIDTRTKQETLIDLSNLNLVGYTSFSKDNQTIYFTGDNERHLYKINFDGTGLEKLSNTGYLYRPLFW